MKWLRRLLCKHKWTLNGRHPWRHQNEDWIHVGIRDWEARLSWWGCKKCGRVKAFPFGTEPHEAD